MQTIFYYVEETDQIKAFVYLVGEYFEKLNRSQLWQLSMILGNDLTFGTACTDPYDVLIGLADTRTSLFGTSPDRTLDAAIAILERVQRKQAKQLVLAIAAIAAESDQY